MYQEFSTLDDLLNTVLRKLLREPFDIDTSRGLTSEITGVLLTLTNPRARLSTSERKGTPFSALGEFLWYLSKKNDLSFIGYYIPKYKKESLDGETIHGGYGPRLFNFRNKIDQVSNVINKLRSKPTSRKAVIQIFDAEDINSDHPEIPCTCTLQFIIRGGQLNMYVSMRSNDAFLGLPHDVFAFTMLQEVIAQSLDVKLGWYKHSVCSLHLYKRHCDKARIYLREGHQPTLGNAMPPMPKGNPWRDIAVVLTIEENLRDNQNIDDKVYTELPPYWINLVQLLRIERAFKNNNTREVEAIAQTMLQSVYYPYIVKRLNKRKES
jgi:thymidylate synthase